MKEVYVKTKGKARVDKQTYTREQIMSPSFTDDYGRIVPPGYVVFDFDKQPYIDIMYKIIQENGLKCRLLRTTKGLHFMFKTTLNKVSDGIKVFNWIGLQCDIKACGVSENKQSYQSLRLYGETREEELINSSSWEDIDYAPKWMYVTANKNQDTMDLTVDQSGGRNNLFHSELMIKAKKMGFSYDEYVDMAFTINNFVLQKPLDEEELNTAIRPEEWDNLELGEDKLTLMKMAEDVITHWNCIIGGDKLAFYDMNEQRFSTNINTLNLYLQEKYASSNITTNKMAEVIEQVNIQLNGYEKYKHERSEEYVLCGKELVSFWKDDVRPNTRTIYTDVFYPYDIMTQEEFDNFNGRAKQFMKEISVDNPIIEQVIWEVMGCMLSPSKIFGKIFIWYGSGANGKSLLLKLMKLIMGTRMTHANILNINDKFALENVVQGLCNVTDDVGITTLSETGLIKSLVDGTDIEVNRKYKDSIQWAPSSQFIMCCNNIPRISDTTHGMIRRLGFIPFDMELPNDKIDRTLLQKIKMEPDNLRYLMTGAIFAYREAFKRRSAIRL